MVTRRGLFGLTAFTIGAIAAAKVGAKAVEPAKGVHTLTTAELTAAELPSHNHSITDPGHTHSYAGMGMPPAHGHVWTRPDGSWSRWPTT